MEIRLLLLFVLFYANVHSQTPSGVAPPDFAPKTPEAAAFLKYGEYPVDMASGVTSISIPLYTIESKDFNLPITLDYHASGIKVDQEATWVGLGWNLNFGAQVVLSAHGDVDEGAGQIDDLPTEEEFDDYFNAHPYTFSTGPANAGANPIDVDRIRDAFVFSSPTANGRFYLHNGIAVVYPPDAFKVTGSAANGFTITDIFGNIYTLTVLERSVRQFTHQDYYNTAWFVKKIVTPNGNAIDFNYYDGEEEDEFRTGSMFQKATVTKTTVGCNCPDEAYPQRTLGPIITSNGLITTESKKIKEIIFNGGSSKVVFLKVNNREDQADTDKNSYLHMMEVRHKGQDGFFAFVKGHIFNYGYFTSGTGFQEKRLKLESVSPIHEAEPYVFKYSDILMPAKNSFSMDVFGYYNGMGNLNLIPHHIIAGGFGLPEFTVGSANREVDSDYNQAGMLTKVYYPTKGWTKFNYETNQYFGPKNNRVVFDGCSVLGVTETGIGTANPDETDIDICTWPITIPVAGSLTITYQITNELGGIFNEENKHHYTKLRIGEWDGDLYSSGRHFLTDEHTVVIQITPGNYTLTLEAYGDSMHISARNIVFQYTTQENIDAGGLRISSIESHDHNGSIALLKQYDYSVPTEPQKSSGSFVNYTPPIFSSIERTNLFVDICPADVGSPIILRALVTQSYDISSATRYGTESNLIMYQYVKERNISPIDTTSNGYSQYKFTTGSDWVLNGSSVRIMTPWKRGKILEKKQFKSVGGIDYISREETNIHVEDTSKVSYIKGFKLLWYKTINSTDSYTLDILQGCNAPQNAREAMHTVFLNHPIYWQYLKSTEAKDYFYNDANVLSGTVKNLTTYHYDNPLHQQLTRQTTTNSKGETIETKYFYPQDTAMSGEPHVTDLITKNIIAVPLDTQTLNSGVKLSEKKTEFEMDTTTAGLLLPKYISTKKGIDALSTLQNALTYDLYDSDGRLLQYTVEDGITVALIWAFNNVYPIAKIENMAYNSIPGGLITAIKVATDTGTEATLIAALNALRSDSALANAMVTTFTYYPLVGVSTVTDPKGIITRYSYDHEGRLTRITDADGNLVSENEYHYKN